MHHIFVVQFFNLPFDLLILITDKIIVASHPCDHHTQVPHSFDRLGLTLRFVFFGAVLVILVTVWEVRAHFDFNVLLGDFEVLLLFEFLLDVFSDLEADQNHFDH